MKSDVVFKRGLSDKFVRELQTGCFSPLLATARAANLDVQIREHYLNFYQDGLSVLRLSEHAVKPFYLARIHWKYLEGISLPDPLRCDDDYRSFAASGQFIEGFLTHLHAIGRNAEKYARAEATVEQKIVRASQSPQSPIVFIDRQVQVHGIQKKADIVGLTGTGQFVITELKQGLDNRIQELLTQIQHYYKTLCVGGFLHKEVAQSYRKVVLQKQTLGLLSGEVRPPDERYPVKCLIVLYAYNDRSRLLDRLRQAAKTCFLPVSLVRIPEGKYVLPPAAEWEQLCPPM